MARGGYVPERGDIVWISFSPTEGHEQAGHRPALVLSPSSYNGRSGLMLCCPITSKVKPYPFVVPILGNPDVAGAALADQLRTLDWRARGAKKKGRIAEKTLVEVLAKASTLLE
jgi:mRNA interferase MazF